MDNGEIRPQANPAHPNPASKPSLADQARPTLPERAEGALNHTMSLPLTVQNSKSSVSSVRQVPTTIVLSNRDSYLPEPLRELLLRKSLSFNAF